MQIEGKGEVLKLAEGYPQQETQLAKTDWKKGSMETIQLNCLS